MDNKDDTIDNQSFPDLNQESEPVDENGPQEDPEIKPEESQPTMPKDTEEQNQPEPRVKASEVEKPKKKAPLIILLVLFVLAAGTAIFITVYSFTGSSGDQYSIIENESEDMEEKKEEEKKANLGDIVISGNGINDFDLAFLKLEDDGEKNIVYSPLSIKYALSMLSSGSMGETKKQIDDVLGTYNLKTYTNSENLSLANALFVNETHQDEIKPAYINNLRENYNAELLFDSFATPDAMNSWIENKTLGLLKDPLKGSDPTNIFYLINALAIDMEWINKIQTPVGGTPFSEYHDEIYSYHVSFPHENVSDHFVGYLDEGLYQEPSFGAAANKYDIINDLGEDKIRSTVQEDYEEWAKVQRERGPCRSEEEIQAQAPDLDEYVETLKKHYGHISSSTDFYYYDDDEVDAFAKDLKTYGNTTLQYIAIKPKQHSDKSGSALIEDYIANISATKIDNIIKNLKDLDWDSYEDGYVTVIDGLASKFDFQYDLKLKEDLEAIGIKDVFNSDQADLSDISDEKGVFIQKAIHSANIGFSNDGIKASAATIFVGDRGAGVPCSYNYYFEVPIKEIKLDFDSDFIFLIRDKDSGEIWFAGSVYYQGENN